MNKTAKQIGNGANEPQARKATLQSNTVNAVWAPRAQHACGIMPDAAYGPPCACSSDGWLVLSGWAEVHVKEKEALLEASRRLLPAGCSGPGVAGSKASGRPALQFWHSMLDMAAKQLQHLAQVAGGTSLGRIHGLEYRVQGSG